MTRTPARTKAKELAKLLRAERPDYAYLKQVFRELRKELESATWSVTNTYSSANAWRRVVLAVYPRR
jgi:hypothetical protein